MAVPRQSSLFHWKDIDLADDLFRFLLVRDNLPDERLVACLEKLRGKGRDDYPIRPMWNLVLAGIVFQHPSGASLIREASRNPALREICGFNPFPRKRLKKVEGKLVEVMEAECPTEDALGRFLTLLIEQRALIDEMLHLVVDSKYELPLAFELTKASTADGPELLPLVEQLDSVSRRTGRYSSSAAPPPPSASSARAAPNVKSAPPTASAPSAAWYASRFPLTAVSSPPSRATSPNGKQPMTIEPLSNASTLVSTVFSASKTTSSAARPRWRCGSRWRSLSY